MRKPLIRRFYAVLAASPPHARRRALAATAAVVLAMALAAVGVVIAVQPSPLGPLFTSSGHRPVATVSGGELIATLSGPGEQVESLAVLRPDGRTLAVVTGAADGGGPASVRLWDVATHRWAATLTLSYSQCDGGVSSVAYSPDGQTLAMFSHLGHETCLWDPVTRKVTILTDPGPGRAWDSPRVELRGTTLVVADTDGRIYLWDLATRHVTATLNVPDEPPTPELRWLTARRQSARTACWRRSPQTAPAMARLTSSTWPPSGGPRRSTTPRRRLRPPPVFQSGWDARHR